MNDRPALQVEPYDHGATDNWRVVPDLDRLPDEGLGRRHARARIEPDPRVGRLGTDNAKPAVGHDHAGAMKDVSP